MPIQNVQQQGSVFNVALFCKSLSYTIYLRVASNLCKTLKCCIIRRTMTKNFQFIAILTTIFIGFGPTIYGQDKAITFSNTKNSFYSKTTSAKDTFFAPKINEITLKPDSTFEFWSRSHLSCFTWHSYKGTWKKRIKTPYFFMTIIKQMNLTQRELTREVQNKKSF